MTLTQAEMEARYDAERNGTLYIKPAATCPACTCELAPAARFCDACGQPALPSALLLAVADYAEQLDPREEKAIDILLQRRDASGSDLDDLIAVLQALDGGE